MSFKSKGWVLQNCGGKYGNEIVYIESIYSASDLMRGRQSLYLIVFRFPLNRLGASIHGNTCRVSKTQLAAVLAKASEHYALRSESSGSTDCFAVCEPFGCSVQGMWLWQLLDFELCASSSEFLPLHQGSHSDDELIFTFRL